MASYVPPLKNFGHTLGETGMPVDAWGILIRKHMITAHDDIRRGHISADAKIGMTACREVIQELPSGCLQDLFWTIHFQLIEYDFTNPRPFIDEPVIVFANLTG